MAGSSKEGESAWAALVLALPSGYVTSGECLNAPEPRFCHLSDEVAILSPCAHRPVPWSWLCVCGGHRGAVGGGLRRLQSRGAGRVGTEAPRSALGPRELPAALRPARLQPDDFCRASVGLGRLYTSLWTWGWPWGWPACGVNGSRSGDPFSKRNTEQGTPFLQKQ